MTKGGSSETPRGGGEGRRRRHHQLLFLFKDDHRQHGKQQKLSLQRKLERPSLSLGAARDSLVHPLQLTQIQPHTHTHEHDTREVFKESRRLGLEPVGTIGSLEATTEEVQRHFSSRPLPSFHSTRTPRPDPCFWRGTAPGRFLERKEDAEKKRKRNPGVIPFFRPGPACALSSKMDDSRREKVSKRRLD